MKQNKTKKRRSYSQITYKQKHVTTDQRVVTGQNPQSAEGVGQATLSELKKLELEKK